MGHAEVTSGGSYQPGDLGPRASEPEHDQVPRPPDAAEDGHHKPHRPHAPGNSRRLGLVRESGASVSGASAAASSAYPYMRRDLSNSSKTPAISVAASRESLSAMGSRASSSA